MAPTSAQRGLPRPRWRAKRRCEAQRTLAPRPFLSPVARALGGRRCRRSRRLLHLVEDWLRRLGSRARHHATPPLRMRREDAVIPNERIARRRNECGEPREKLDRCHDPMRAAWARRLHAIRNPPVGEHAQPIEREARPGAVTHEELTGFIAAGVDAHPCVKVEASVLRAEATARERNRALHALLRRRAPPARCAFISVTVTLLFQRR